MIGRSLLILTFVAFMAGLGGCKKDSSNPMAPPAPAPKAGATAAVSIANFAFGPASLTVAKGTTVTWTNTDAAAHTSTSDNGAWDTGSLAKGASGSFTFTTAGTYPYHCTFHSQMTATIVVQ